MCNARPCHSRCHDMHFFDSEEVGLRSAQCVAALINTLPQMFGDTFLGAI